MMNKRVSEQGAATAIVLIILAVLVVIGVGSAWYVQDQRTMDFEERVVEVEDTLEELETQPTLPTVPEQLETVEFTGEVFVTFQLDDGSVTSAKIQDGAITSDKLSEDARLLLQGSSNQELKLGENSVEVVHVDTGAVTTGAILDAAVTTAKLADGSIVAAKILNGEVTSGALKDGTVTAADMITGAVMTIDLADGAVTAGKLADGAVTTTEIVEGAVTNEKVQDAAVQTVSISDLSITAAKIATGTLTGDQFSDDIAKSVSGSSVFEVTDNEDGTYSLALETSCLDDQVLAWNTTTSVWVCTDQSGSLALATVSGLDDSAGLAVDIEGSDLELGPDGLSIAENFLRNDENGSVPGTLTVSSSGLTPSSSAPSTAEGTLYYDSDDDTVYLRTATGFVSVTEALSTKAESDVLLALKADASDVYTKTETYTQSEIDVLASSGGSPTGAIERVALLENQDLRSSGDLDTSGNLLIYTVPTGKRFLAHSFLVDFKSGSTASIGSLGSDTGYSNIFSFLTTPFDDTKVAINVISRYDDIAVVAAGEQIYLTTYSEATGANAYDFHLYGWLEDE